MTLTPPANVNYGKVVAQFLTAVGDSASDSDNTPDFTPATGNVTFTPRVDRVADPTATPPVTIWPNAIVCTLDANGVLLDPSGNPGVYLLATDDPDLVPTDWTYEVKIELAGLKLPVRYDISVLSDQTIDLSEVAPPAPSSGISYVPGPKGDQGDPGPQGDIGPAGPANVLSIGTVTKGIEPAATITGTSPSQTLNLTLPQGDQGIQGPRGDKGDTGATGPANTLSIGTVVSGDAPDATITGTAPDQTLNLTLQKGDTGPQGPKGDPGTGSVNTVNGDAGPDVVLTAASVGAVPTSSIGVANGVASLAGDGTIPTSQIPALAYGNIYSAASQAAMLALSATGGDVAARTDGAGSFMLKRGGNPATLADWVPINAPTDAVVSVNGQSGTVNLNATNVGAVPTSRTVNGKALSADISLAAADVAAVPTSRTVNSKPLSADVALTAADVSAVPTTRTVNSKPLSADVALTASDVGALASGATATAATKLATARTIAGKSFDGTTNVAITASDVGAASRTQGGAENVAALSATTGTATGDCSAASWFTVTPTGAITLAFSNVPASGTACTLTIEVTQGATAYAVNLPTGGFWLGSAPTQTASKKCLITAATRDGGSTWICSGAVQA